MGAFTIEDEAALVELAKTDSQAFRQLYERHLPGLYRYAYYRTGSREEAEDVVAHTFLKALEHLHRYEHRGIPFSHWLYRIAGNALSRRKTGRERLVGLTWEPGESNDSRMEQIDERLDLAHWLRSLPDAQQQVLALRYIQDLSLTEVAGIMGRSEGAIKQLAFRGLQALRERMGGYVSGVGE